MSEIFVNIKCEACNGNFDDEKKIPMILVCGHQMCYEFIYYKFLNARQIQCVKVGCNEITHGHPTKLKFDEGLLQFKQSSLQNDLNTLKNLEKELSQEVQKITKFNEQIVNKFLQDFESYLLASSSDVQKDLQSMLFLTKKKITDLLEIQGQLQYQSLQGDLARQEQRKMIEKWREYLIKSLANSTASQLVTT